MPFGAVRYGVIMNMAEYLMFDIVAVLALSYTMTRSNPQAVLTPLRPTSRLFSATTVASVVLPVALNLLFFAAALLIMEAQDG